MHYGNPEDHSVELIIGLVHLLVIVSEQHEKWYLMQDKLLAETNVQVIGLDIPKHRESRKACVHHERKHKGLCCDFTDLLQSAA